MPGPVEEPVVTSTKTQEPVDIQKVFHYTDLDTPRPTRVEDPYEYQWGFGNRFQSEIIPGTLPVAQNHPQVPRFNLYTEGLTSSAFASSRTANASTYMYRCRPSVANHGFQNGVLESRAHLESCFLAVNPKVKMNPAQIEWAPFDLPQEGEEIDFVDGLHTLGGSGDANMREGLALHVFMINARMTGRAFLNGDGEFLIVAQLGNLDIQTEMGKLYLQPGEICVIPRGIKFCLNPAAGTREARGYVLEVWGSRFELPDLGPIGGYGNANARDFAYPVAYMDDVDELHQPWHIVEKINGEYHALMQDHSPFDVAAWHGNCLPYKYDMTKFVAQGSTSVDHTDPSIWTLLTARSRDPNVPLVDFIWFGPRWDVAMNSFRLPYFHRNSASEFIANIYGASGGRSANFRPGGGVYEAGHTAHGGFGDIYVAERRKKRNEPRILFQGMMTFMIESSRSLLFTEWSREHSATDATPPEVWDSVPDQFSTDPKVRALLQRVKKQKAERKAEDEAYYDDERIAELVGKVAVVETNGTNGTELANGTSGQASAEPIAASF
ncbi:homogentisate 1,2-dioxygenase [Cladophialophora carrionii CBS 160.54]|uniref:homogentisate 1,2-dioxygenase n=1 Tax=Cladophialophora carrionii CBS 160.54 TaxID=1279043 RepID=V9D8J6_9EURO|nr:homogentisate 1,2-dioxygenase [Cladophialophora carrionii CBS 160.54]ETI22297.1 homogentisate 1,2-dioxygenase [Cladophialophora carrionii CBS 160.54]